MRALPQLSALKLLVTEDFLVMYFCCVYVCVCVFVCAYIYIYIYVCVCVCVCVSTEQVGSSIKTSLHLEGARFESQVDCYAQFFGRSWRIMV